MHIGNRKTCAKNIDLCIHIHTYSLAILRWITFFEIHLGVFLSNKICVNQLLNKVMVDMHGLAKKLVNPVSLDKKQNE